VRTVETDDPYYRTRKRFRAIPLNEALVHGFGKDLAALREESFVLRALDGYAVPIDGSRLLEGGAYLAFDDVDVPGFAPIGPQQVSPAPTYLVWTGATQTNLDTHPRPWQLAAIEIAPFASLYPHTVPNGEAAQSDAMRGFEVFRDHCLKCHAINREGGRVGPELNVPQSIVEYRPVEQIRAYIKDPTQFRYGAMPAHPQLTESDLDHLIAYFGAMSKQKHDTEEPTP
jgi:mono/diheme cytochrome c family protein